jgi:hypothetical protein
LFPAGFTIAKMVFEAMTPKRGLVLIGLSLLTMLADPRPAEAFPVQLFASSSTTAVDRPPLRLELAGNVYTRGRFRKNEDSDATWNLELNRARLGFEMFYAELLRLKISTEFSSGFELKDAYLDLTPFDELGLRVGQQKVPFGQLEWHSRWELPLVSRGLVSQQIFRRLGFADRRVGARVEGTAKSLPLKPRLELGVFQNGDVGDTYDVAGRLRLRLFKGAEIFLAGYQRAEARLDGSDGRAGSLAFEWDRKKVLVLVEGVLGRARRLTSGGLPSVADATFYGVRGLFGYKLKVGPASAQPYLAAEILDPGVRTGTDLAFAVRGGVNLVLLKILRLTLEVDHRSGEAAKVIERSTTAYVLLGARID